MKEIVLGVQGSATMTGDLLAIYSPQPLTVRLNKAIASSESRVTVKCARTGRAITETRTGILAGDVYTASYELSRMLQIVCDVESVLDRVKYDGTAYNVGEDIDLTIETQSNGVWKAERKNLQAIYAAVDWGETLTAAPVPRRLFVNYPQTLTISTYEDPDNPDTGDAVSDYYVDAAFYRITGDRIGDCCEFDVLQALREAGSPDYDAHLSGKGHNVEALFYPDIREGQGSRKTWPELNREYILKDDRTTPAAAVYLRWLQRDGSVGYWLFRRSKETTAATAAGAYTVPVEGVPAAPTADGVIRNAARQEYTQQQTITAGAANITDDEYGYLLGLLVSPCVEMLVGGTRTEPQWLRVNLSPATVSREIPRSGLSRLRTLEINVILPERNTIKL